ncbi:MAG: hypothetical protein DRN71_05035 [Candidatus Nanohalarchaeota archaeon]|nr:MAG: hypothetical protein DRN71_05035 [Candidatus Nanohaloarchaeota archaeon]
MGFFDKVKGMLEDFKREARRKEEDNMPSDDDSLKYKEVPGWLDSVSKPFLEGVNARLSEAMKSLESEKLQLEKDIASLSSAKIEESRDKRMERAVVNNRRALLSRLNVFCHNVRFPKDTGVTESSDSLYSVKKQMNSLMSDTTKNFYFVSSGISSHSEDVKKDLFEMSKIIDSTIKYVEPLKGKIKSIDDSHRVIEEINALFLKKKETNDDILSGNRKLKELRGSEKIIEKKLKAIEKGSDIKTLNDMNEEHEKIIRETNTVKIRIVQTVSPVSRALRKYSRVAQLGSKSEKRLLELYIEDPVAAVRRDDRMKLFGKVIGDVEMHVSRDSITLKDKLKIKTISALSRLKEGTKLSGLREKMLSLDSEEEALRAKIESDKTMKEKKELECEHAKLFSEIESQESDVSEGERSIRSMEQDIKSRMTILEGKLSGIGNYNVKIIY